MHTFLKELYVDHQNIGKLLNVFAREVEVFAEAGDPDYDVLEIGLEYCSEYMDAVHHRKEEEMLAQLRECNPEAAEEAAALSKQHHDLEHLTNAVRAAFTAVRDDAFAMRDSLVIPARKWVHAYQQHLRWEEEVLFKVAQKELTQSHWDDAQERWHDTANPLHDKAKDNRFAQLAEAIHSIAYG